MEAPIAPLTTEPAFDKDMVRIEHSEAAAAFRHYSGLRFAILAVFLGISGAALQILTSTNQTDKLLPNIFIAGLTVAFGLLDNRITSFQVFFDRRLHELEAKLGFQLYSQRTSAFRFTIRFQLVSFAIYLISTIFWIGYLFFGR